MKCKSLFSSINKLFKSTARDDRSRSYSGFTIIETLIVLALAGMILLIVFEAIPALERSSRNSARKQDVQAILAAVDHFELNNSGDLPNSSSPNFLQYTKLYYYSDSNIEYVPSPDSPTNNGVNVEIFSDWEKASQASISPNTNQNTVNIYNYQVCSTTSQGASTTAGAGYNDIVALYSLETSSSSANTPECQQI